MSSTKKKERSPRSRALRFGVGALVLLGAFGGLLWWRKHHPIVGGSIAGVGAAIFLVALASPAAALGVRRGWMTFAGLIGWVNSRILLGLLFFVVITPIALFRRMKGREAYSWKGGSGWRLRDKEYDPKHYEHPY